MKQEVEDDSIIYLDDLLKADIDKYISWVFNHKAITREEKKKSAISALGLRKKTITNYRKVIQTEFIDTTYWKEPTDVERKSFPIMRKQSYEQEIRFGQIGLEGNPMPVAFIKEKEAKRICNFINRNYSLLLKDILGPYLPTDFYNLALLTGKIDYLKYLSTKDAHTTANKSAAKSKLSLPEIGVLCYYNNRKVTLANNIAIAKEYGITTKKHTVNTWFNNASGNTFKPEFIERRIALHHIHRLEHILESEYLNIDKKEIVENDIKALKRVAENKK